MVILDADHPDVADFINCKSDEEQKAWTLIDAGYDGGFNVPGGAYDSVYYQNANHSVRVTDTFMEAVLKDGDWTTITRTTKTDCETYKARDLMTQMADAAWLCGDPGIQFDTTVNDWHTCPKTDRINASNPCSEYMFLDDSACNLASLNLMKFRKTDGSFDVERFEKATWLTITAQEILVSRASYPTPSIEENSHAFRPLGLGYANLGALLMASGLPYDSEEGRAYAGAITALMHGNAYLQSSKVAATRGAFDGYAVNEKPMLRVMNKHRKAARELPKKHVAKDLMAAVTRCWNDCVESGKAFGFRNSQVTVLAPTGTIGFMMDCDTTGIEPDIALIKYKKLVGGGLLKIVNQTVPLALEELGYNEETRNNIQAYLDTEETIEGAPGLLSEHLPVFDCAFKPRNGKRTIAPMGHVRMMSAAQPFLSGAISKTVNVPPKASPADIADIYIESWKLGLKAIAIYRDGCKRTQPLNTSRDEVIEAAPETIIEYRPVRRKLPNERDAVTHKFSVAGHDGYITVGLYEDNTPGEIFLVMAKEGSVVSGLMDAFATSVSMALQYGVPLQVLCNKFSHTRFEPSGFTGNPEIPIAKSITDYIFRWMELRFGKNAVPRQRKNPQTVNAQTPIIKAPAAEMTSASASDNNQLEREIFNTQADAPPCHVCGSIMVRSGACYKCFNCGATSGCS
jgi:ribonucleoside-diphosphate reductase alpha chain